MNKKLHLTTIIAAALTVIFSSCTDDIYKMINQEVSLETNGISGHIYSLVRYGNNLYTSNGYLYEKSATPSATSGLYNEQWRNISRDQSTFTDKNITYLASDSNYLYALVIGYEEDDNGYNSFDSDESSKRIYYYNGTEWNYIADDVLDTLLGNSTTDNGITNVGNIFCNQAVDNTNRHAFARLYCKTDSAYYVYTLDGGSAPTLIADKTNGTSSSTVSAVYYKGSDYFSSYTAITANGTYIYYSKSGDSLYYADQWDATNGFTCGGTEKGIDENAGSIYSLSVTNDFILMGTEDGLAHVAIAADGKPSDGTSSFENNAASTLTSTYEVHMTFALDPTLSEYATDLYGSTDKSGSSVDWDEIGLWAYYPGRSSSDYNYGTWNKDGTNDDEHTGD